MELKKRVRRIPGEPPKKPGPKPFPSSQLKRKMLGIQCTEAWQEWIREFAKWSNLDISVLVDESLVMRARAVRYPVPPPPR
jgi:hypothetical protein